MFSKKSTQEISRKFPSWIEKMLDPKKEMIYKFLYLKKILENMETGELTEFFNAYPLEIFVIFYEEFMHLEISLKARGGLKACIDYFIFLCGVLKRIIFYLPYKIKQRWQYNSIHYIIKKMIHPKGYPKIRCYGLELYIIWIQCLQNPEDNYSCSLLPDIIDEILFNTSELSTRIDSASNEKDKQILSPSMIHSKVSSVDTRERSSSKISLVEQPPIYWEEATCSAMVLPNEKVLIDVDKIKITFFEKILDYFTNNILNINWTNKELLLKSFECSFILIRRHIIYVLFPSAINSVDLYYAKNDTFAIFTTQNITDTSNILIPQKLNILQNILTKWIIDHITKPSSAFTPRRTYTSSIDPNQTYEMSSESMQLIKSGATQQTDTEIVNSDEIFTAEDRKDDSIVGINNSIEIARIDFRNKELSDIIQKIFFNGRDNISCIFEIFRQSFFSSKCQAEFTRKVLYIFYHWGKGRMKLSFVKFTNGSEENANTEECKDENDYMIDHQRFYRILLYLSLCSFYSDTSSQINYSFIIPKLKRSIRYVRILITGSNDIINNESWTKILDSLLDIYSLILNSNFKDIVSIDNVPNESSSFLSYFCQTLFVAWIRGNMSALLSSQIWDKFSNLLINGFYFKEMFIEWNAACEIITWLYCSNIFDIDIYNLVLDRTTDVRRKFKQVVQKSTQSKPQSQTFAKLMSSEHIKNRIKQAKPATLVSIEKDTKSLESNYIDEKAVITLDIPPDLMRAPHKTESIAFSGIIKSASESQLALDDIKESNYHSCEESQPSSVPSQRYSPISENTINMENASLISSTQCEVIEYDHTSKTTEHSYLSDDILSNDKVLEIIWSVEKKETKWPTDSQNKEIIDSDVQHELLGIVSHTNQDPLVVESTDLNRRREDTVETENFEHSEREVGNEPSNLEFRQLNKTGYWNKDHIALIWKRTLGLLGNLNNLEEPISQASGYKIYLEIFEKLEDVAKNYGVDDQFKYTLSSKADYPPLTIFVPLTLECLYDFREKYIIGHLEAMKLLIKSILTPYHITALSNDINVMFIDVSIRILSSNCREYHYEFFKHSYLLLSSKIEGSILLFEPILNCVNQALDSGDPLIPCFEISVLLMSMASFFLSFGSKNISQLNSNVKITPTRQLSDLEALYLSIIIRMSTSIEHSYTRINALRTLFQFSLDYILQKREKNFIFFVLALLVKHLYSKNFEVLSVVCSMLYTYAGILSSLVSIFSNIVPCLFNECCIALQNLVKLKVSSVKDKCNLYNILIMLLDFLLNILLAIKHKDKKMIEIFYSTMINLFKEEESKDFIDISHSPNNLFQSFSFEEESKENLVFIESFTKIKDVINNVTKEPPHLFTVNDTKDFSNPYSNIELNASDRYNSLLSKVEHVTTFCIVMLNNFPFILGSECLSSLIYEEDILDDASEQPYNCLAACINDEVILVLMESSDNKKNVSIFRQNITGKEFDIDNASTLINIRTPLGKFSWLISELISFPKKALTLSQNKISSLHDSEHLHEKFDNQEDKLLKILNYAHSQFPESAFNYDYIKTKKFYTDLIPCSDFISRINENIEKNMESCSKPRNFEKFKRERIKKQQFSKTSNLDNKQKSKRISSLIFSQFGYFFAENRSNVVILSPTSRFFKDARQLDFRLLRSSHKIAVFYVKRGQEDKESILSNQTTSPEFSSFISGLGWPIEVSSHLGFIGGLEKNSSSGCTATYYSTAIDEVIYHVAPHMPLTDDVNGMISKLRHLGNDEIHIVWSEHFRPFRRGIINTEFGDVIIVIHPMENGLYRINILGRSYIPIFGPLTDGCIVSFQSLPVLVRETAINASRAIRTSHPLYKTAYEDRLNIIKQLKEKHQIKESFEQYVSHFVHDKSET